MAFNSFSLISLYHCGIVNGHHVPTPLEAQAAGKDSRAGKAVLPGFNSEDPAPCEKLEQFDSTGVLPVMS